MGAGAVACQRVCLLDEDLLAIGVNWINHLRQLVGESCHWLGICGKKELIGPLVEQRAVRRKVGWRWGKERDKWMGENRPVHMRRVEFEQRASRTLLP